MDMAASAAMSISVSVPPQTSHPKMVQFSPKLGQHQSDSQPRQLVCVGIRLYVDATASGTTYQTVGYSPHSDS